MHTPDMDTPHAVPCSRAAEINDRKPGILWARAFQTPSQGPRLVKTGPARPRCRVERPSLSPPRGPSDSRRKGSRWVMWPGADWRPLPSSIWPP
jgi:hypothetical protein